MIKYVTQHINNFLKTFCVFPSGYHWSSHLAAEKGHLGCSVCEDACLSRRGHGRARTENDRLCRSRPQRSLQGGRHARCAGELQGIYSSQRASHKETKR